MNQRRSAAHWRLLFVPPRDGAENMARDVALMDRARSTGEFVFSVYGWSSPTLSFGRNQAAASGYDRERVGAAGIDVVRRPTGGRSILHHREVTYSVTGPDSRTASLSDVYDRINDILYDALREIGVPAEVAMPASRSPAPDFSSCFEMPVRGELIAEGRKLVGSAQYREGGAFLQHGSILVDDDQSRITEFLIDSNPRSRMATAQPAMLREFFDAVPSVEKIANALFASVRNREDPDAQPLAECEIRADALGRREQFLDPLWTWRR